MSKLKKNWLKDGDQVYCTGCYLVYDAKKNVYIFDSSDDDIYFQGDIVNHEDNKPYVA